MATKRRTEHDSPRPPRKPDAAVQASPSDRTAPEGRRDDAAGPAGPEAAAPRPSPKEAAEARAPEPAGSAGARASEAAGSAGARASEAAGARAGEARAPGAAEADRRIEELATQLEQANASRVRIAADFENYRKRARQEQMDTMRYAAATVAERLLPVLDDADRALSHAPEGADESWLKGVKLTFQKLEEVLASVGVERIEAVGSAFDPKDHEAVGSEETAEHPEDTVVAELRAGYRMHDRVLRPALVRVARPPA